jgi:hypothetical protein
VYELAVQGLSGCADEYAGVLYAAGLVDANALAALTPELVGSHMPRIPPPRFKSIARAGHKAATAFTAKFGGAANLSGALGETASSSGEIAARLGAPAAPKSMKNSGVIAARGGHSREYRHHQEVTSQRDRTKVSRELYQH